MTQDEIIEMAIQGHAGTRDAIRWAINQVVKAEREACAQIADKHTKASFMGAVGAAIRARGEA